ncbi:MAG TPA: YdcF family protein [Desulfuromonadales bacterium]|nr:YdcF family protein [Desulfuromonadales bacterium]
MSLVVKKIIAAFLLPPGCIILMLSGCALFHFRRRRTAVALGFIVPALLLWALSSAYVADALLATLERNLIIPTHPAGDVIVMLGSGSYDRVPDLSGSGAPTEAALARMVTAVRLQRRLDIPILVSGGSVFDGHVAEAQLVRRFMIDLGVPSARILVEDKSRDTIENARFSRKILQQRGFTRPLLVTSAFHMRRAKEAFRKAGVAVTPVPSSFQTSRHRPPVWADWFPDAGALGTTSTVLREYLGLLYYTLAGKGAN